MTPGASSPGGWVPISKALLSELPKDRAFTRLEAMFSLTVDYDQGNTVTVKGYSVLWGWSQGKVKRFLEGVDVSISYPQNTSGKQNQRGEIVLQITERSDAKNGKINMIDSRWLGGSAERSTVSDGEKTERSQVTTITLNPKPLKDSSDSDPFFEKLWSVYPRKDGKKQALRHYLATVKTEADRERVNLALGSYLSHIEENAVGLKFIKNGSTFFNNWQDWVPEEEIDAE